MNVHQKQPVRKPPISDIRPKNALNLLVGVRRAQGATPAGPDRAARLQPAAAGSGCYDATALWARDSARDASNAPNRARSAECLCMQVRLLRANLSHRDMARDAARGRNGADSIVVDLAGLLAGERILIRRVEVGRGSLAVGN